MAYGALAIVVQPDTQNGYGAGGQRIGLATLVPGDSVTVSYDFRPADYQVGAVRVLRRHDVPGIRMTGRVP